MANTKKKWVAFKGNLTIPAAMTGGEENLKVQRGESIQVPAFYADSVVQDGIAEHCDAPKKKKAAKAPVEPTDEENAAAAKLVQIEAAKTAVTDAENTLMGDVGTDAEDGARVALTAAEDALAALQD